MEDAKPRAILRSLREDLLHSLLFWNAATAFVGAFLITGCGVLGDLRIGGFEVMPLSLVAVLFGCYGLAFTVATVFEAGRRRHNPGIYAASIALFSAAGWGLAGLL